MEYLTACAKIALSKNEKNISPLTYLYVDTWTQGLRHGMTLHLSGSLILFASLCVKQIFLKLFSEIQMYLTQLTLHFKKRLPSHHPSSPVLKLSEDCFAEPCLHWSADQRVWLALPTYPLYLTLLHILKLKAGH